VDRVGEVLFEFGGTGVLARTKSKAFNRRDRREILWRERTEGEFLNLSR
jgi:hypothetical protein